MNAEQIVRTLAANRAPVEIDEGEFCLLCDPMHGMEAEIHEDGSIEYLEPDVPAHLLRVVKPFRDEGPVIHLEATEDIIEAHDPSCPWRLAQEWVAEHPRD